MTSGLTAKRVISGAQWLGAIRESLRYAVFHMQRRLQFGQPTMEVSVNQLKVAHMITKLALARTFTYYTAYLIDQGQQTPLESAIVKLFNADSSLEIALEAIQCMGGDGLSQSYPPARAMRDAKLAQIVAGTQEINRVVIFRQAMRLFEEELKIPPYRFHEVLGVPMPTNEVPPKQKGSEGILKVMAEFYRVHPALHMSRKELLDALDMTEAEMDRELQDLERQNLVDLYHDKKGKIALARATYEGLARVHPPRPYRSVPGWVDEKDLF